MHGWKSVKPTLMCTAWLCNKPKKLTSFLSVDWFLIFFSEHEVTANNNRIKNRFMRLVFQAYIHFFRFIALTKRCFNIDENFRIIRWNAREISLLRVPLFCFLRKTVLKIRERNLDSLSVSHYPRTIVKFKLSH